LQAGFEIQIIKVSILDPELILEEFHVQNGEVLIESLIEVKTLQMSRKKDSIAC